MSTPPPRRPSSVPMPHERRARWLAVPLGLLLSLGASATAWACSTGQSPSVSTSPNVTASPTSLDFGLAVVGTATAAQSVTLTNKGNAAGSLSLSVSSGFAIVSKGCGSSLAVGASCTVSLDFKPSAAGVASGDLTVAVSGGSPTQRSNLAIRLSGIGLPTPPVPTITAPTNGAVLTSSVLGATSVPVTVEGTYAIPDVDVTIYDGSTSIGSGVVTSSGTFGVAVQLAYGQQTLTAVASALGITSGPSNAVTVTVVPAAPTLSITRNGPTTASVTGSGVPGATVTVSSGGTTLGTTTVGSSGSYGLTVHVTSGSETVTATQTDGGATSSASSCGVPAQSATTLTTALSAASVQVGAAVSDSATLSGATSTAGGTVTYSVYSNSTCTTLAASGGTVTVNDGSVPSSSPVSLTTAGTYYWQASYSGDAENAPTTSACGSEVEVVTP